jgi:hypothetical protein
MTTNSAVEETPPILSVKAAQRYLGGISRAQAYRMMDNGSVESTRIGGRRMIIRASLDSLIERSKVAK